MLAAGLLLFLLLILIVSIHALRPQPEPAEEDFVTEFIVEDRVEEDPVEEQLLPDLEELDEQDLSVVEAATTDESSAESSVDEIPPEELAPEEPPIEVVVVPETEMRRQSVDQPTTNQEPPETDDYFLAEVDNRADEQTIAEDATDQYQDEAPVDTRMRDSESERSASSEVAQASDSDSDDASDSEFDRENAQQDQVAQGSRDAFAEEIRALEARRRAEEERAAQSVGERATEQTTTPLERHADGRVYAPADAQTATDFGRASGLGTQMQRAQERSEQDGQGRDSIARDGAIYADRRFDEMFGERTAEYRERSQQTARRESLLGDQQGDWQRTREALENYDVAVTAGTETMLNTRRDDHARFINAFHARIHDPWWKVLELLDRRYTPRESMSNRELTVRLEIRVLADGVIDRVRIVSTSGNTYFDAEALRVNYDVRRTPAPRADILCDDGSVYLHWTFSRMPGRCGTHGASVHCPRGR